MRPFPLLALAPGLALALPFALPLALLPWSPPQEPEEAEPQTRQLRGLEAQAARLRRELLGTWQLVEATMPGEFIAPGEARGFMLVLPDHLSFELHVRVSGLKSETEGLFFQTGTHTYRIDDAAQLHTNGLIGTHNITDDEEVEFDPPGAESHFNVTLTEEFLVLDRLEGGRTKFVRLGRPPVILTPEELAELRDLGWERRDPTIVPLEDTYAPKRRR